MDDKELYDILKESGDDIKREKDTALKKLNEMPQEEVKRSKLSVKPQIWYILSACLIALVLCIALPISLTSTTFSTNNEQNVEPTYTYPGDVMYNLEDGISTLKDKYGINALFPTFKTEDPGFMSCMFLSSRKDDTLKGATLGYVIDDDKYLDISLTIIPKTHIVDTYKVYFELPNEQQWREFNIKYGQSQNDVTAFYDTKIYYADSKYDYFVKVESDVMISVVDLLDMLYCHTD